MAEIVTGASATSVAHPVTVSPGKVFWATWFGWMLDGFDSSMYSYILVGALTELLPASGIAATPANIGLYGGLLFSIFMLGWACSMIWGWAADRYGRVRIMCWTVLVYSVFTALCGLSTGIVMFALFRFVAGFGIGGEWAAGTPLLQESVPENMRVRLAGWLHTATPTGLFLAAFVTLVGGSLLGWRGMFFLGILPALLIAYLRSNIPEPARSPSSELKKPGFTALFAKGQARTTWSAAAMMACIIFGLWSSNFWAPTVVATKLVASGATPLHAQQMGAVAGLITNVGTLIGCLLMPWITGWFGSRAQDCGGVLHRLVAVGGNVLRNRHRASERPHAVPDSAAGAGLLHQWRVRPVHDLAAGDVSLGVARSRLGLFVQHGAGTGGGRPDLDRRARRPHRKLSARDLAAIGDLHRRPAVHCDGTGDSQPAAREIARSR
jgi:MFS family permease